MKTDIPNGWWFHHLYRDNSKKRERPAERWHRDARSSPSSKAPRRSSACLSGARSPGSTSG